MKIDRKQFFQAVGAAIAGAGASADMMAEQLESGKLCVLKYNQKITPQVADTLSAQLKPLKEKYGIEFLIIDSSMVSLSVLTK